MRTRKIIAWDKTCKIYFHFHIIDKLQKSFSLFSFTISKRTKPIRVGNALCCLGSTQIQGLCCIELKECLYRSKALFRERKDSVLY